MAAIHVPKELRERVAAQARHRCGYCLSQENILGFPMEIDHLIPQALGGPTVEENLWLACSACNSFKGYRISARDPQSGQVARLFDPREQRWEDHFFWVDAGAQIEGKTTIGRATTAALYLNRPLLVHARRAWVKVGWHPPKD